MSQGLDLMNISYLIKDLIYVYLLTVVIRILGHIEMVKLDTLFIH
jgi:hypothetical protein